MTPRKMVSDQVKAKASDRSKAAAGVSLRPFQNSLNDILHDDPDSLFARLCLESKKERIPIPSAYLQLTFFSLEGALSGLETQGKRPVRK